MKAVFTIVALALIAGGATLLNSFNGAISLFGGFLSVVGGLLIVILFLTNDNLNIK